MADITVRGVSPEVHRLLAEEAERSHRSLTSVALAALDEYAAKVRSRARRQRLRREMDALRLSIEERVGITADSAELLREDRNR